MTTPKAMLAFDTATAITSVAVEFGGRVRATEPPSPGWWDRRPAHSRELLSVAASLLDEVGSSFGELGTVVVGVGPGTFTGLRIGVSTARALAQASGASIVPVSTLETLAQAARERFDGPRGFEGRLMLLSVVDAKRGEVFSALYSRAVVDVPLTSVRGEFVASPEALSGFLQASGYGSSTLAVGDGAVRYRTCLESVGVHVPSDGDPVHAPDARFEQAIARSTAERSAGPVLPTYLRATDAERALRRTKGTAKD